MSYYRNRFIEFDDREGNLVTVHICKHTDKWIVSEYTRIPLGWIDNKTYTID